MTHGLEVEPPAVELATGEAGTRTVEFPAAKRLRRERMLVAALAALDRDEYEQIQMREIAEAAGVALGTVYRYFASKELLYASTVVEWATFAPEMAAAREVRTDLPPEERVRARMHGILAGFGQRPRCYKVHVLLRTAGDANAPALIEETEMQLRSIVAGDLSDLPPARADDVALMLWAICDTALLEAINRGRGIAGAYRVVDHFIDLLVTPLRWACG